ncbi:unnamed protein product [Calicophoron daubneyi]|uniref:Protein kinase domain-containing protein n=1 Tax=Calicophoron daubneyi TaxID=300641 RepID=A0AAV2TU33_CALDB
MYCEELSNSVQSIDLHDNSALRQKPGDECLLSEDSEETSILKSIKAEGKPILPKGYHLSHCLAEGGVGRVFLVVNPETKDCLAAKVVNVLRREGPLSMERTENEVVKLRADLRQEAELQRRLRHHNIATVYGIRNTPSFTFMFMELLPGGELFERIPIGIGLHVQQMFIYYAQILDALHYLHTDQLIAHLDVKPENIMLTRKDKAKLIDFGWAVDLRKNKFLQGPVGTTSYAAPEVFGKGCFAGPPADLFSLGVTLLTAVTGQRCWLQAHPSDSVYAQWINRQNFHNGPIFSRLPPDLVNFLTRALAHRPNDRLTIEGIRAHPWYHRGVARRLTPVSPPPPSHTNTPNSKTGQSLGSVHLASVPSSQPAFVSSLTQIGQTESDLRLSQPADISSMLMASQALYNSSVSPSDARLGFSYVMKRMTRFFSALPSLDHTMEVIRAVIIQKRQLRATARGPGNLVVSIRSAENPGTAFRILLYPLAGSILVDCRRIAGDGLLFHQTYAALYSDLMTMGAVNDTHPYLRMVLPEHTDPDSSEQNTLDGSSDVTSPMEV